MAITNIIFRRQLCASCRPTSRLCSTRHKENKIKIEAEPPESGRRNWVGPPDPVSNIRPIKFYRHSEETDTEKNLRQSLEETVQWNHHFWKQHNSKFFTEKEEFLEEKMRITGQKPSVDDLAGFYRNFLDNNRQAHRQYNREWYKRNVSLLWPALQVSVIKAVRRLRKIQF